ncbi:MAG: glycosyltransferase [Candidatus Doudnabacteria bacterium]|nr:glycosyltransferase [Candidatus Doudnabacteria bacterium]
MGLPQDKKIVMYTGHVYEWKGADVLLEAARLSSLRAPAKQSQSGEIASSTEAPRNDQDMLFIFVGGTDWDMQRFRPLAEGLANVLLLGQKPHDLIPKYLGAADILVLPNSGKSDISKYYTSPLKMFEYMAAGKPIVASDLPAIREVLNENNAVLVRPDDPQALAQGIKRILENPDLGTKLANQARLDVASYNWPARAQKIMMSL